MVDDAAFATPASAGFLKCFLVCHVLLPIKEVRGGQVGWGSTSPNKRCLNHPWEKAAPSGTQHGRALAEKRQWAKQLRCQWFFARGTGNAESHNFLQILSL
jgi:hypothetical protein